MDVDAFRCPICLELAYKPVVNECGHVFCFWCVHRAMSPYADSYCPICRRTFAHFPRICLALHRLLQCAFPEESAGRAADVSAEERESQIFSPDISALEEEEEGHEEEGKETAREGQGRGDQSAGPALAPQSASSPHTLESICSCQCCQRLLLWPTVLGCGHVFCRPCVASDPTSLCLREAAAPAAASADMATVRGDALPSSPSPAAAATAPDLTSTLVMLNGNKGESQQGLSLAHTSRGKPSEAKGGPILADGTPHAPLSCDSPAPPPLLPTAHQPLVEQVPGPKECPKCGAVQSTQALAVCLPLHEAVVHLFPKAHGDSIQALQASVQRCTVQGDSVPLPIPQGRSGAVESVPGPDMGHPSPLGPGLLPGGGSSWPRPSSSVGAAAPALPVPVPARGGQGETPTGVVRRAWEEMQAAQQRLQQAGRGSSQELQKQLEEEWEVNSIHTGVGCDGCGAYPIVGKRFRCLECSREFERIGFDLCSKCVSASVSVGRFNQRHTPEHTLQEVKLRDDPLQRFLNANGPDTLALIFAVLEGEGPGDDLQAGSAPEGGSVGPQPREGAEDPGGITMADMPELEHVPAAELGGEAGQDEGRQEQEAGDWR